MTPDTTQAAPAAKPTTPAAATPQGAAKPAEPAATKAAEGSTAEAKKEKTTETAFDTETGVITVETQAKNGKSAVIKYQLGKTIEEATTKLGREVALSKLAAEIARNLGNNARGRLQKGVDPAEVAKIMADWKPGITTPRGPKKSVADQLAAEFAGLSPEAMQAKMQEMIAKIQASQAKS